MTTQEQLEKIIKRYIANVPIKGNLDGTQCLYINEGATIKLASAILSAMRIDENKLTTFLVDNISEHLTLDSWPQGNGYEDLAKAIASHAQEIIKFEEE